MSSGMSDVIVVVGAGSIGQAIARRVSSGKRVLNWRYCCRRVARTSAIGVAARCLNNLETELTKETPREAGFT